MKTPELILEELNRLPDADDYSLKRLKGLVSGMQELTGAGIRFLDFKFNDEKRHAKLKKMKFKYVKKSDFETAAHYRDLEKECMNYIELRSECGIEKSMFFYDGNNLCYFYLGNARNDRSIKRFFEVKVKSIR